MRAARPRFLTLTMIIPLAGCSALREHPACTTQPSARPLIGPVVLTRPIGPDRLVVAYGSQPPSQISSTNLMGSDLQVRIERPDARVLYEWRSEKDDLPLVVDYSRARRGFVWVTSLAVDGTSICYLRNTPFITDIAQVCPKGDLYLYHRVVLNPGPDKDFDDKANSARSWLAEAEKGDPKDRDFFQGLLTDLRQMAVADPEKVAPILKDLRSAARDPGLLRSITLLDRDVSEIAGIRKHANEYIDPRTGTASEYSDLGSQWQAVMLIEPLGFCDLVIASEGFEWRETSPAVVTLDGMFRVLVRTPNADTVYSTGVSEVDDPIVVDYSNAASGIVCITSLTQDARKDGEYVALTREIVDASREGEIVVRREVTLPPEPLDGLDKLLDETRALLHSSDDAGDRMDRFWINLLHLRNMAVTDPDRVMAAVELFSHDTPGHFGCIHNDIMGQIGQIKDCHDKPVEHIPTKAP